MTNEITITPEAERQVEQAEALMRQAEHYAVTDAATYNMAGDELKRIKNQAKELDALRVSMTRPLDEAKKKIMDFFRRPAQLLADAESAIKRSMLTYQREEERKRREAEARAQEAARKEQERLRREAAKLEAKGKAEQAAAKIAIAESLPAAVVVAAPAPHVQGISTSTRWSAEVTDLVALARAVGAGEVPAMAIQANTTFLGQQARSLKGQLNYPGVRAVSEESLSARAG